jgi:hypothetical protein
MKKSLEAVARIERYLKDYACGGKNEEAISKITEEMYAISREAGDHTYVRERLEYLRGHVSRVFSARSYTDPEKRHAFAECYKLTRYLEKNW